MHEAVRDAVRERAGYRCEYCTLTQRDSPLAPLQIEHIIPKKHGGSSEMDNLALACIDCNLHKGANLTGIDSPTSKITPLFHPRKHDWCDHFAWEGLYLVGQTDIGRTTVQVLNMNSEEQLALRAYWNSEDFHQG